MMRRVSIICLSLSLLSFFLSKNPSEPVASFCVEGFRHTAREGNGYLTEVLSFPAGVNIIKRFVFFVTDVQDK
jgi:hypothetical protein